MNLGMNNQKSSSPTPEKTLAWRNNFIMILKHYGLDVWLDTEPLLPGDKWKDKITAFHLE